MILRQISLQNLCRLRGKVYMNPTWRKKCRIASPSGFCECFWTHEKKTQTTQTRLRRSNASHNLSRYVLLTRACRSRPLLRAFSPRLRGARACSSHEQDRRACNSVFFSHMFKVNRKHPRPQPHTPRVLQNLHFC